jgi:pyruvate dehydrogenase E1 component alpha subunit/2-oxoisovalerate dehydrogenase E1 component alpha subunit
MLQVVTESPLETSDAVRELHLAAFRYMLRARLLDEKFAALYRAGKMHGGVFLGRGQEALSAATGLALNKHDVFAPLIRDQAGRLAFGETIVDAARTYLGSVLGSMRGRDGNVHRGDPRTGLLPMISHLGAMVSVVNGILFARRLKRISGTVGAACLGEGATSTGAFHEALNQAAIERLPLVLVVANNQYAYSTPTSRQFACDDLTDRAAGYGVEGHSLDGTDLTACLHTLRLAVDRARAGHGPQLVVAQLLRLCGHGEHDDASYIDPKLKDTPLGRDCMKVAREILIRHKWADHTQIIAWQNAAVHEIEVAVAQVQREPAPDPFAEKWTAISTQHLIEGNERPKG